MRTYKKPSRLNGEGKILWDFAIFVVPAGTTSTENLRVFAMGPWRSGSAPALQNPFARSRWGRSQKRSRKTQMGFKKAGGRGFEGPFSGCLKSSAKKG